MPGGTGGADPGLLQDATSTSRLVVRHQLTLNTREAVVVGHRQTLWDAEPRRILSPACGPMDPKTMHVLHLRLKCQCDQGMTLLGRKDLRVYGW